MLHAGSRRRICTAMHTQRAAIAKVTKVTSVSEKRCRGLRFAHILRNLASPPGVVRYFKKGKVVRLRLILRLVALFLLTLSGSVESVRIAVVPSLQDCACGCGAPSDDLCKCKGPAQPAAPPKSPDPCSQSSNGCSTNTFATSVATVPKKAGEPAKDPEPKQEPNPWPLQVAQVASDARHSLLQVGAGFLEGAPPPSRCLERLALLSVFRN